MELLRPIIQTSAPGKIILFGEHSVVYGKLAVAASLNIRTSTQIYENISENFEIFYENLAFKSSVHFQNVVEFTNNYLPIVANDFNLEHSQYLNYDKMLEMCEIFLNKNIENFYNLERNIQTALMSTYFLVFCLFGSVEKGLTCPIFIKIRSDLDVASGTGSSASFLVSVTAALIQYIKNIHKTNENASKDCYKYFNFDNTVNNYFNEKELKIICDWSFLGEKIIHGTPSGLDNTICTYGNMVEFRKGIQPTLFTTHPNDIRILLIDSKIPKNTKNQVEKLRTFYEKYIDICENILRAMEDVSFVAINKLKELKSCENVVDILEELQQLTSVNHGLLSSLGLSHSRLDEILLILNEYDLKGKMTGAGGGGYVISIIPVNFNIILLETIKNVFIQRGFNAILTTTGCEGVRIDMQQ